MYKKPVLILQEDLAEGIFAASGGTVTPPGGTSTTTTLGVDVTTWPILLNADHIMVTFSTNVRYVSHTIGGYQNGNNATSRFQPQLSFRNDGAFFNNGSISVLSEDPSQIPTIIRIDKVG